MNGRSPQALIDSVRSGSLAHKAGLVAGDAILSVNGQSPTDLIDLSFAFAEEKLLLQVKTAKGEEKTLTIKKRFQDDLGIEFASAVFDDVRRCANRCIFCFVDQMAPGMRDSLYIKDDDYRLSFLYGNFITLTNLTPADVQRIRALHLSPLYISVHVTDPAARARMLGRKEAAILEPLDRLLAAGIEVHTQVVLCPGENDGNLLERTIQDLLDRQEQVLSLAIVPVGLTKYRADCYPLKGFTVEEAQTVVQQVTRWQEICLNKYERRFVFLSDEFYLQAGLPLPGVEEYEDFPQLENGVGLVADFCNEWNEVAVPEIDGRRPKSIAVACGVSAGPILEELINQLPHAETVIVQPVMNRFFGEQVTVTGLLTGSDYAATLALPSCDAHGIIIPGVSIRKGEEIFLDGMSVAELERILARPVRVAHTAAELKQLLCQWS